jgi:hypothetical protein
MLAQMALLDADGFAKVVEVAALGLVMVGQA